MQRKASPATSQSILCPVDFSAHSQAALRCAAAIAGKSGARLVVVFANDPLLVAAAGAAFKGRRQFEDRTHEELAQFVERTIPAGGARPTCVVAVGEAGPEIVRAVKRYTIDLVVIGTQGLSGVSTLFFGSTTAHVLRHVKVPVLAMPPSSEAGTRRQKKPARPRTVERVIAPLDLAGSWRSDAQSAAVVARGIGAELLLVHVVPRTLAPPWLQRLITIGDSEQTVVATRALERVRGQLPSGTRSSVRVLIGDPAVEIAKLAASLPGSLAVMALRDGIGIWQHRRGSIAYHVLTHGATPVMAVVRLRLVRRLSGGILEAVGGALSP
jgi:universal stress protein A